MTETHKRECPNCGTEIEYTNKRSWYNANRRNSKCRKCADNAVSSTLKEKFNNGKLTINPRKKNKDLIKKFHRNCPNCGDDMWYVSSGTLSTAIKRKTICNRCSVHKYNKTFKDIIQQEHIDKMRATKAGFSSFEEYKEKYPEKEMYKRNVWRLTYRNDLESLDDWEKRGRCGVDGAYQLDHIISISDGYERGIPPEEIADMSNLRMIPWRENLLKG